MSTSMNRLTPVLLGCALALAALPMRAQPAPSYPDGPVHLVVPFPAGSVPDTFGRLLAQSMAGVAGGGRWSLTTCPAPAERSASNVSRAPPPTAARWCWPATPRWCCRAASYGVQPPYQTLRDLAPVAQLAVTPQRAAGGQRRAGAPRCRNWWRWCAASPGASTTPPPASGLSQHRAGELLNAMAGLGHGARAQFHQQRDGRPGDGARAGVLRQRRRRIADGARRAKVRALAVSSLTRTARRARTAHRQRKRPAWLRVGGLVRPAGAGGHAGRGCCSAWNRKCARRWPRRRWARA